MSTIKTRVRNKNDTKAHWDLAEQFKPLKGEIILYTDTRQMKVGDGETLVGALPFYPSGDVKAAGNNTFTGTNTFQKSQSDIVSKINVDPGPVSPLISVEKKDQTSGIAITSKIEIDPENIKMTDNGADYLISMTHDGFKVSSAGIYTSYGTGTIAHNTGSSGQQTLSLPNKTGTLALTSDLPVANSGTGTTALTSLKIGDTIYTIPSGDVTAAGDNTFTGMTNTFTNQVNLQGFVRIGSGNSITNLSSTSATLINVNLPPKQGTLAITDDIDVTAAGNNTFTGSNTYYGDYVALAAFYPTVQVDSGILKVGQVTSNNDANHTPTGTFASSTDYGNGGITYRPNTTTQITYMLPSQAGTLALRSDITTVVANPTASGTTTLTKLTVGNTTYNIPSGGSGDVTAAGDNFFVGDNTFDGLNSFVQMLYITQPGVDQPDPCIIFCKDSNSLSTSLHATSFDGDVDLYLPFETGTLATQEWTRALFTYSNNTLTINI